MLDLNEVTPPTVEPITADDVRAQSRIDIRDDDALIENVYIKSAREWMEQTGLWRTLITTTFDWKLDRFPWSGEWIEVPRPPLQSVTLINYVGTTGATQTWSNALYQVDTHRHPGRIAPAYGQSWPSIRQQLNPITIRFVAGYGATASTVPAAIRHALAVLVAQSYEHREPVVVGSIVTKMPFALEMLIANNALKGFA